MYSSAEVLCTRVGDRDADETMVAKAAVEDRAAFGLLYEHYRERVYAYLRLRTQSPEDASDLTQQVFLRALLSIAKYRGRSDTFAAWLFRIAHNAAVDFHRRERATLYWDLVPPDLQPFDGSNLEADIVNHEAIVQLQHLMVSFDRDTREMLALRFAGRLKIKEISRVVGKSEAAVKKRLFRAIGQLKECYNEPT